MILVSCSPDKEKTDAAINAPKTTLTLPPVELPVAPPPALNRAEILAAVALAGEAFVTAEPYPDAASALVGRQFSLKTPFGCYGPHPEDVPASYAYDASKQALKLIAKPQLWTNTPWVRDLVETDQTEAIEGFWIERPWLIREKCPAPVLKPNLDKSIITPSETVGLVQVYEKDGSRLLRRGGRAYEVTRKASKDSVTDGKFRLVLEGRIVAGADGRPVQCHLDSPNHRPVCLVRVEFSRVAFENTLGEMFGEWRN